MRNSDYWARRMKLMQDAIKEEAYKNALNIEAEFNRAIVEVEKQMRAWFQRFADNNGLTLAEAQKWLNTEELKELKWTVEEYIKYGRENALNGEWVRQLENASAKAHISRLDSLRIELRQQAEQLGVKLQQTAESSMMSAYGQSYLHTAFTVQSNLGVGWALEGVNSTKVQKVLSKPWTPDGKTFSTRIWDNQESLLNTVNTQLTQMLARGQAPDKAIKAVADRFNVSKKQAGRLVMTESAAMSSAAQKDCFNDLNVEQYKIVATLDRETCPVCGDMDGRVFKMTDYREGETANPFHPWCRCCTAPYFADMEGLGERYARDAVTGERYKIEGGTTYEKWKTSQDEKHGEGTVDKLRKMGYNESADKKQFSEYQNRLGNLAPKNFKAFQAMKYDAPDNYTELCGLYKYKGRVPEATKADFNAYKGVKATGVFGSVRVPPERVADVERLALFGNHVLKHNITLDDAKRYVEGAKFSVRRKRWDGYSYSFYSPDGAAYLDELMEQVKTAFPATDYDPKTLQALEVFK